MVANLNLNRFERTDIGWNKLSTCFVHDIHTYHVEKNIIKNVLNDVCIIHGAYVVYKCTISGK